MNLQSVWLLVIIGGNGNVSICNLVRKIEFMYMVIVRTHITELYPRTYVFFFISFHRYRIFFQFFTCIFITTTIINYCLQQG